MAKFQFLNDFEAAGYGVSTLTANDCVVLDPENEKKGMIEGAKSVKAIIGPGTGLGQGILIKLGEND